MRPQIQEQVGTTNVKIRAWELSDRCVGALRGVGKVCVIVGTVGDTIHIFTAEDKVRAAVVVGGGWAGATAMATFVGSHIAWWNATPIGAVAFVAVEFFAGGFGYFLGSTAAGSIYDVTINQIPPSETDLGRFFRMLG